MMVQANTAPKLRHQPPTSRFWESVAILHRRRTNCHRCVFGSGDRGRIWSCVLRSTLQHSCNLSNSASGATFIFGGIPLVYELARNLLRRKFGSDLLAGISIVTSVLLHDTSPAHSWS